MFIDNILNIYGERGKVWLDQLPLMIERIASKYHLSELTPLENLSYNYVIKGLQNDKPIILKLSLDINGLKREINALRAFQGYGAVSVLEEEDGMLILERVLPGHSLKSSFLGQDDEAVKIVCDIIKRLHQAPIAGVETVLPVLNRHCEEDINRAKQSSEFTYYLDKALKLEAELLKSSGPSVLLHGDLHHDNIIRNGDSWVVIDPKGYIGDSAYEVAAFIRNPIPDLLRHKNATEIITNRIRLFAQYLDLSEERIVSWCYVGSVQAWIWALEDNGDTKSFEESVQVFDGLLNQSC
jgi:streptomycin 6-kinase